MNFRISSLAMAALGACTLFATSCVGPEGGYVSAGTAGYGGPSRSYSNYSVVLGDGYAGRGYYYGPPNTRYFSRQPGVTYYRTRESVPQHYWGGSTYGHSRVTTTSSSYRPGYVRPSTSSTYRQGSSYRGPSSRDGNYRGDGRSFDRRDDDRRDWDRRDDDRRDRDDDDNDDDRRYPSRR